MALTTPAELAAHLKGRAASYRRDGETLQDEGDVAMSLAYKTIADELRRCAEEIPSNG